MIRQLLAFFVVSFALAAGMPQKNEGHSSLHPPLPAPYPTAEGWIHLTNDGSQQKFAAKALSLPMTAPPGPFEVWLENGLASNVYFLVGPMIQSNTKVKNLRDWELVLTATGGALRRSASPMSTTSPAAASRSAIRWGRSRWRATAPPSSPPAPQDSDHPRADVLPTKRARDRQECARPLPRREAGRLPSLRNQHIQGAGSRRELRRVPRDRRRHERVFLGERDDPRAGDDRPLAHANRGPGARRRRSASPT